jgi:hypothetical protein
VVFVQNLLADKKPEAGSAGVDTRGILAAGEFFEKT